MFLPVKGGSTSRQSWIFIPEKVGWSMGDRLTQELATQALEMAVYHREPTPGLIHHSDRGSQYDSRSYQQVLWRHGMICSMSRKGDCWDNAVMESFFHTIKTELINNRRYKPGPKRVVIYSNTLRFSITGSEFTPQLGI